MPRTVPQLSPQIEINIAIYTIIYNPKLTSSNVCERSSRKPLSGLRNQKKNLKQCIMSNCQYTYFLNTVVITFQRASMAELSRIPPHT